MLKMRLAGKRASMATKRVTINDIAAAAGVSKATVSRYLNGKNELISLPTQVRIKRAIEVSGYRLNVAARALSVGASNTVGIAVNGLDRAPLAAMAQKASVLLSHKGYKVIIATASADATEVATDSEFGPLYAAAQALASYDTCAILFLDTAPFPIPKAPALPAAVCVKEEELENTVTALADSIS